MTHDFRLHRPRHLLRLLCLLPILAGSAAFAATPTLTNISDLSGTEDQALTISYNLLDGASNANDSDGHAISYRVEAVSNANGTLRKNGAVVTAGTTTLATGESWEWTPAANLNGNNINAFTVRALAHGVPSALPAVQVRVDVAAVNDAPAVTGSITISIDDDDADTADSDAFLKALSLSDVENDDVTVVVRIPKSAEDIADLSLPDSTRTESGLDYVYTYPEASLATANSRLDAARFGPLPNVLPPGTSVFDVRVDVTDGTDAAPRRSGNVSIVSVDDPPVVGLSFSPSTITDDALSQPFRVTLSDPDIGGADSIVTLTLTEAAPAKGTLTIPAGSLTGNKAQVEAGMTSVSYMPTAVASGSSITANFTCAVQGTTSSSTGNLTILLDNDPPDIAGITTATISTDDNPATPAVRPFQNVIVSDPDAGQPLSATVTLDNAAKGTFTSVPLTGTAAEITQKLRLATFKPTPNRVAVGQTETTALTLLVSDGAASRSNNQTRVAALSVNGAPVVELVPANTPLPFAVDGETSGTPFSLVNVSDDDTSVTVTVTLDNTAKGTLSGSGFTEQPSGSKIYVFNGPPNSPSPTVPPTDAQSALQALVFTLNPAFSFPPNQPGATTFTIEVKDSLQNRNTLLLPVVMRNAARNFLVTLRDDPLPGLPLPVGSLRHAVTNAKDNDVITFALEEYPAVIRLHPDRGTLVLTKHLRFKGPGADLLTISGDRNADGTPDMQLFKVQAGIVMEGLTLAHGTATIGGAVSVSRNPAQPSGTAGSLTMIDCAVIESRANQWGGAIDVEEGALTLERCLLKNNSTDPSFGEGGGAISLYTSQACSIVSTTFSGNRQGGAAGWGGGAIYAENFNPQVIFPVTVTHCTFSENEDAANSGTSILASVFNCRVTTRGSIFADAAQRNLGVAGSGQILSGGRNVSNDATRTTLIQGGQPQSVVLLNQTGASGDKVETDPLLLPLAAGIAGTEVYALSPLSPAIGTAAAAEGPDQRGVLRDATPDSGAAEFNQTGRIIVNEVQSDPADNNPFIELYIPRDSTPVNVSGLTLWVDGVKRHTFAAGTPVIQPGFGIIVAETVFVAGGTTVIAADDLFWDMLPLARRQRSTFELRSGAVTIVRESLVNVFADSANLALNLSFPKNSLSLAPQFRGHAFVPHSTGQSPPLGPDLAHGGLTASPGSDTGNTPFGQNNSRPFAAADSFIVNEDDLITLPVLVNDIDADGLDKLVLVDVSKTRSAVPPADPAGDDATAESALLSAVSIAPAAAPLRGTTLSYDPRAGQNHLPVGISAADTFYYTIVDIGTGPVTAYASAGAGVTAITSPAHRLSTGDQIVISGAGAAAYNAAFTVTKINADSFSIPVAFAGNPAVTGAWTTTGTRQTTKRSENSVAVTVMGRNDAPTPLADTVATDEEKILRIMGDPDLISSTPVFDTDPVYPAPRAFAGSSLLVNDKDPDDDDNTFKKLRVVGVARATPVLQYLGTAGNSPVSVKVTAHGFASGDTVLISGYGGHASYNAYHTITVTDPDTFTIPVAFVENHAQRGLCGILTAAGRLQTTSAMDAQVNLEIRSSRLETNVVYVPRGAPKLNRLSRLEHAVDSFFYVVEDSHGAQAFAEVTIDVTGVNDTPVPQHDPPSLSGLASLVTGGTTLPDVLAGATVEYSIPTAADRATVTLNAGGETFVLGDVPRTNEDTALSLTASSLLGNDADVDHLDTLRITLTAGQNLSREGAAISLAGGGATVVYNPSVAARLNALARDEKIMDTFAITIGDGTTGVVSIVAVEVTGRNDKPTALADAVTIPEDQLLTVEPPLVLLNDRDPDQDTRIPDNRKLLIPVTGAGTTVYGTRLSTSVAPANGDIDSFATVTGNAAVTQVNAPAHGLNTGEEIIISGTSLAAYNGQFPVTRVDAGTFTIPVPAAAGAVSDGSGTWESLRSTVLYDPRGSVFTGSPAGTVFTLDGLAQGQTYVDTWTYTMFDSGFVFANDDTFRVAADSTGVVLPVSSNDVNLTGLTGALTIISVGTPSQRGTAGIGDDGTILYTPEVSFVGDEFFLYTVADTFGNIDTALVTVRVTVEQLNGNLQANRDAFSVAKGQSPLLNVLANDDIVPATGAVLTITDVSTPPNAGGTAVIESDAIRYTPAASAPVYPYTETFTYEINAGGSATATASVTIQVINRENTLALRPDAVSVEAGSSGNPLNVLANDNILPGSGLALSILPMPPDTTHGTVTVAPGGKQLNYSPDAGFIGTDQFTYQAGDGLGGTGTATVRITVGGLTTNNDFFTVPSAAATPFTLDVLANDRFVGTNGVISLKSVTSTSDPKGSMALSADRQTLIFTPIAAATGDETFTYRIEDGTGREADGSVTVFLSGPGLRANSDFFTVQAGTTANQLNVLLNDAIIPDLGQIKSIVSIGTGSDAPDHGGTVTINAAGTLLIYTPAAGFTGEEKFTCTVTDGGTTAISQVVVTVSNGALAAGDDSFSVFRTSLEMRLEVLANDRVLPPSGQVLTITGIGIVQNAPGEEGTVTVTSDGGALLYTPNPSNTVYPYTESFTYEISDGTARRAAGTVFIEVLDLAGARDVDTTDDAFTVLAGSQNTLLAVMANDNIRPATAAGWEIDEITVPNQGGNAVASGEGITYTPRAGFVGTETFGYTVNDGLGGTGTATVTVKVGDVNVSDDRFTVLSGSGDTSLDVLANDGLFPDGFPDPGNRPGLTGFTLDPAPMVPGSGGTAIVSGDHILYRPAPGFTGEETFTYRVKDDSGISFPGQVTVSVEAAGSDRDSAVLSITVTGVNDTPVFENPSLTVTNDRTAVRPFPTATVSDVDNQRMERLTLRVAWPADRGTFSGAFTVVSPGLIEFSGTPPEATAALRALLFRPTENRIPVGTTEETVFHLTIDDGFVSEPVAVDSNRTTVTPVNDRPVFANPALTSTNDRTPVRPFPTGLITDVDDLGLQRQTVTVTWPAVRGSLTGAFTQVSPGVARFSGTPAEATAALRALLFTPTENRIPIGQTEATDFVLTIDDGFAVPPLVVNGNRVVVTPVNDPPGFSNPALTSTDDRTAIHPFATGTIFDVDNEGTHPITVRVTWPVAQGSLTGGFTVISPGVIQFLGQPAEATAALRGLLFAPVENRIPVGQTEETAFLVTLDDGVFSPPVTITGNRTLVTPVNDLPQITGTVAGQLLYQMGTLQLFAGVHISDVDNLALQVLQVTVQIDDPVKGILTNTGGFIEQPAGSGIHVFTGTPEAAATALRGFVFDPTPEGRVTPSQSEIAVFTITVTDNFSPPVVDDATTVVVLHAEVDVLVPLDSTSGQDASQPAADFGGSTAVSGDTLVIGSPRRNNPTDNEGAVHVYERDAGIGAPWGQVAILTPSDLRAGDRFGSAVAIHGDVLAVGAPNSQLTGSAANTGSVYIFQRDSADRNSWLQVTKLLPPVVNGLGGDTFGSSLAIQGTTLLIGAPHTNIPGESNAGRVHIFERDQGGTGAWGLSQSLVAADERSGDNFGNAVALDGNTAVIGAADASRTRNDLGWQVGAAYVFDRPAPGGTWTETRKLENFADPESRAYDHFGFSVDIDRDTIAVGATRFNSVLDGIPRVNTGAVFVFDRNTGGPGLWGLTTKLISPTAQPGDLLGQSVSIAGDLLMAGAPRDTAAGTLKGYVNVHHRNQNGPAAWGVLDRLTVETGLLFDRFGVSVSLDGFTGAVGATEDHTSAGTTRVYQFQYDLGPRQAIRIPDQTAPENQPFLFALQTAAFGDPVYDSDLTFTAALADGSPLPAGGWLSFDPATATFSGTPVPANNADYQVVVFAANPLGTMVSSNAFAINVVLDPARALQRAYAEWAASNFPAATLANPALEAAVWGMLANPDGDSAANLHEMLYGTPPRAYGPPPVTIRKHAGPQISVTFPWAQGLPLEFIHVEWSTSLQSWQRQGVGYTTETDSTGKRWITATIYPDSAVPKALLRIAVGL